MRCGACFTLLIRGGDTRRLASKRQLATQGQCFLSHGADDGRAEVQKRNHDNGPLTRQPTNPHRVWCAYRSVGLIRKRTDGPLSWGRPHILSMLHHPITMQSACPPFGRPLEARQTSIKEYDS